MPRIRTAVLLVITGILFLTPPAYPQANECSADAFLTQPEEVGCVSQISEKQWLFFSRTVDQTDRASIWRWPEDPSEREEIPVRHDVRVRSLDTLRLQQRVHLEMFLNLEQTNTRLVARDLDAAGLWTFDTEGNPVLTMTHGQVLIEQLTGTLRTYTKNTLGFIHSTTVFLHIDSTRTTGRLFLREGRISFPDYNIDVEGTNLMWQIGPNMAPTQLSLTPQELRRWQERVEYNSQTVWTRSARPILRRPRFWIGAGIGVLVAATLADCTITHVVCGGGGETGGIIRIPIP